MTLVERAGEGLARRTNRRHTLARAAGAIFGVAAAWATQGPFGSTVLAARCARRSPYSDCNPPWGLYCSTFGNFCDGSACKSPCKYDAEYYPNVPQSACWCTAERGHKKKGQRFYYRCCDCQCPAAVSDFNPGGGCGCRERVRVEP